ncbi:MAG: PIG-L family deacetylase [Candidatus Bathyarchaeota archaeon]|nr:PIG-L family deacetylase [Candidatus Bathyarchaeota archaeon]
MHDRKSLAIVGAHIGDCEVMAGGISVKAAEEEWDVHLIHMTGGEKGHPNLPPEEYLKQKKKEAEEFADHFGLKVHFMPYGDGELEETVEVKIKLAELFRAIGPSTVLTHWRGSFHKDHIATYNIVLDATFYAGNRWSAIEGKPCSSRVFFAENWEDNEDFQPEIYVDIGAVLDKWVEALRKIAFARGETGFNYIDYYTSLARMRGLEMGVEYAEVLMRPLYSRRITITQLDEL